MTIQLTAPILIAGVHQAAGTSLTLAADVEAELVNRGAAVFVGSDPARGGLVQALFDPTGRLIVTPDGLEVATLGSNVLTVGDGGMYSTIQEAIDSITDNLPINYSTGTVSVTSGSATITFSSAPANDKVVAGRDLFTVDGSRWYRIKSGPTATGGATFTLFETYQGATNATATFGVYKPNPRTILLLPGVYDYTGDALARNVMLKPYVGIVGLDRDSCVIRRNKNNPTPTTTPLVGVTHGSWLRNLTLDTIDGHFIPYRMGLTARGTSQTQAMKGSFWLLDNVAMLNKDPNGIDSGADYDIDTSFYNDDELLFDRCYFEHCWDGFTWNTQGGRLKITFNNPVIYKTPLPDGLTASGATFIRAGVTGSATTADLIMVAPVYNQKKLAAGEVVDDGSGGAIARFGGTLGGTYGMLFIGGGATATVVDPAIDMDVGLNLGRNAGVGIAGTAGTTSLTCIGGYINIAGAGGGNAADHVDGACNELAAGVLTVCGTRIESGKTGVRQLTAGGVTNLQGGARIKGTTNSLVNTAGTMNQSTNVSLAGVATSGVITSAET